MKTILKTSTFLLILLLLLVACGLAPTPSVSEEALQIQATSEPTEEPPLLEVTAELVAAVPASEGTIYRTGANQTINISRASSRLIIKDAEIKLLVENTDVAIDRITQVVSDVGGYIISSRVWYKDWGDESYKYSNITIGVPADQFERSLSRLRGLALRVTDEKATGEDVTDQFVDIQSKLENLQATRERIFGFLDQAETVTEALTINAELSKIEGQIEELQGRINYLSDRSAFSTITINIEPELPEILPAPTPTPQPTPTPIAWAPSKTFEQSKETLIFIYRGLFDTLIWIGVVILPVVGLPVVIIWLVLKYLKSKSANQKTSGQDSA